MAALLTNTGIAQIIAALNGDSHTAPTYVHWGTGTTTEAVGDTALQTAGAEARTNGTKSKQTTNTTNDTYRVVGSITATGAKTVSEAGLFDAASAGNMYVRGTFTGIPLSIGDAIEFTIEVVLDQA